MSAPGRDRLRVLLVVPVDAWEQTRRFYSQTLGFEEEYERGEGDRRLAGYADGPSRLVLATPGAVPAMPETPTRGAVILLEVADPPASRAALGSRGVTGLGPIVDQDGACFFELCDPAGNRVWCIRYPDQPDSSAASTGTSSPVPKRSA
ncbi:MAG: hypothetical protein H6746_19880 [Deltaproteobacteria bacterium]|nr:hypothetical protein [Deltaproteobacteria bacterium]